MGNSVAHSTHNTWYRVSKPFIVLILRYTYEIIDMLIVSYLHKIFDAWTSCFLISLFELRLLFASIRNDFEVIQLKYVWWLLPSLSFRKFYISKTHTYDLILSIYPPFPLLLYFYPFAQFFIAIIHCSYCLSHDSIALLHRFVWKRELYTFKTCTHWICFICQLATEISKN